jgi:hypothetical protein
MVSQRSIDQLKMKNEEGRVENESFLIINS